MASTFLLIGEYEILNAIAASQSVTSTDADSGFALDNIRDGEPGSLFRFGSAGATLDVTADLNVIKNSGFENWGTTSVPDDWEDSSNGTGLLFQDLFVFDAGVAAVRMIAGGAGNEAGVIQRRYFAPGAVASVSVRIRTFNGVGTTSVFVHNDQTGKYLLSNGTWSATRTAFGTETGTAFATKSVSAFTIEASSVSESGLVELAFEAQHDTGSGIADEFVCWPAWTFSGVFAHTIEDAATVKVRTDSAAAFSSPTDEITFSNRRRPSFFGIASSNPVTERFAQLQITGTPTRAPSIGEWVVGTHATLPRAINLPYDMTPRVNQFGELRPASVQRDEAMEFPVRIRLTEANWDALRYTLMQAGRWGGTRAVIVPQSTRSDVYFGSLVVNGVDRERPGNIYMLDGTFRELDYPVRVR